MVFLRETILGRVLWYSKANETFRHIQGSQSEPLRRVRVA